MQRGRGGGGGGGGDYEGGCDLCRGVEGVVSLLAPAPREGMVNLLLLPGFILEGYLGITGTMWCMEEVVVVVVMVMEVVVVVVVVVEVVMVSNTDKQYWITQRKLQCR